MSKDDDDTLDLFDAKDARDDALEAVKRASGEWFETALSTLEKFPPGVEGVFEMFRVRMVEEMGLSPPPNHHNAWGALASNAVKRGILEGTGRMGRMKTAKSHARKSEILRRRWTSPAKAELELK